MPRAGGRLVESLEITVCVKKNRVNIAVAIFGTKGQTVDFSKLHFVPDVTTHDDTKA